MALQDTHTPAFSCELEVRDYELDSEGIVNNARYLHYLEHTRHLFCRDAGISFSELCARGIITVVRRIEIDYISPLRADERFESSLWLERKGARFIFHQHLKRIGDGQTVVKADVTVVGIENGRLSRGDELADLFSKYI